MAVRRAAWDALSDDHLHGNLLMQKELCAERGGILALGR